MINIGISIDIGIDMGLCVCVRARTHMCAGEKKILYEPELCPILLYNKGNIFKISVEINCFTNLNLLK